MRVPTLLPLCGTVSPCSDPRCYVSLYFIDEIDPSAHNGIGHRRIHELADSAQAYNLGLVVEMVSDVVTRFDFRRTQLRDAVWERRHIVDYPDVLAQHSAVAGGFNRATFPLRANPAE